MRTAARRPASSSNSLRASMIKRLRERYEWTHFEATRFLHSRRATQQHGLLLCCGSNGSHCAATTAKPISKTQNSLPLAFIDRITHISITDRRLKGAFRLALAVHRPLIDCCSTSIHVEIGVKRVGRRRRWRPSSALEGKLWARFLSTHTVDNKKAGVCPKCSRPNL